MIDLHCHILPGVDFDGPQSQADVLEMGRIAAADGIRQIVATVHLKDVVHPPAFLKDQVRRLNRAFEQEGLLLTVLPGAEVNVVIDFEQFGEYTLNGSGYVLLEFPHSHLPRNAEELVFNAAVEGLRPIIAHPERNPSIISKPELAAELVSAGALLQLTADSLLGAFGPESRECALCLLERGLVHVVASDAHSPTWRPPVLSRGVKAASRVVGETLARRFVEENPAAIIAGKPL